MRAIEALTERDKGFVKLIGFYIPIDSYEKWKKDAVNFHENVHGDAVIKTMDDGRELLYSNGAYAYDLKEAYKHYCSMVAHSNETIEHWKKLMEKRKEERNGL